MMKKKPVLLLLFVLLLNLSCSSTKKKIPFSISGASSGLIKNNNIGFPLYLTASNESRNDIIPKTSPDVFIIHTGHILKIGQTKEQNMAALDALTGKGIDVVNLSIEDFIVADQQGILLEKYPQRFLNSSVVDLNEDSIVSKPNITPYIIHDGVALIGISDNDLDKLLTMDKFLVSDYVLAILKARKLAIKDAAANPYPERSLNAFVIIHTIGPEINNVMERLPPNFINSLAD